MAAWILRSTISTKTSSAPSASAFRKAAGFLRTFLYDGFNQDEKTRRVFDGVWADIAGAGRGGFNARFAQPSRDGHPFFNILYPVDVPPFTDEDGPARQRDHADQHRSQDFLHQRLVRILGPRRLADPHHARRQAGRAARQGHAHLLFSRLAARNGKCSAAASRSPESRQHE